MARQNLERLQWMCEQAGKVSPSEWPEGLIGVGPDMRRFVKAQEDAPAPAPKKTRSPKKKADKQATTKVESDESTQE